MQTLCIPARGGPRTRAPLFTLVLSVLCLSCGSTTPDSPLVSTSSELPISGETTTAPASTSFVYPPPTSEPDDSCTEGYSPCLPLAPDYDCAGGSGDGPAYTGLVQVSGSDPYGLDADNDGVGCE
jgi:hypothetical protein